MKAASTTPTAVAVAPIERSRSRVQTSSKTRAASPLRKNAVRRSARREDTMDHIELERPLETRNRALAS
jgi:hypothetical protein